MATPLPPSSILFTQRYHSPCGDLLLGESDGRLCLCTWLCQTQPEYVERRVKRLLNLARVVEASRETLVKASRELDEYFCGERKAFDIPLLLAGTEFQKRTWQALDKIPYGEVITYAEQAQRIGSPQAVRAVAHANGANALSIFLPCHRVIGGNHQLTGYAGGLDAKRFLLELEQRYSR